MQKYLIVLLSLLATYSLQAKATNTVVGKAEAYMGKEVSVFFFDDYISKVTTKVGTTKVDEEGQFSLRFYNEETRKVKVQIDKNYFFIYLQPEASYKVEVENDGLHKSPVSMEIGFFFIDLPEDDINYKIVVFENKQMDFLQGFYDQKSMRSTKFVTQLDTFKLKLSQELEKETDEFFKAYVKFSIASLDNLAFVGQRNEYEKFDFYIKTSPIYYQNDRYMDYILHYFELYETQLSNEVAKALYEGVIKSSPSMIMNALGGDYALKNVKLRELVLTSMLSEMYYTEVYPQTNILEVLDSLSVHALFVENRNIAAHLIYRLTDLQPGSKMPDFKLNFPLENKDKFNSDFFGKHVYIQFVEAKNKRALEDLKLLKPLAEKYSKYVHFVTVLIEETPMGDAAYSDFVKKHQLAWDFAVVAKDNPLINRLKISQTPYYYLLDAKGYVVAAPALTPRPNNAYETIEINLNAIARYWRMLDRE